MTKELSFASPVQDREGGYRVPGLFNDNEAYWHNVQTEIKVKLLSENDQNSCPKK